MLTDDYYFSQSKIIINELVATTRYPRYLLETEVIDLLQKSTY